MKRREFITLLGGAAAWPLAARAQQDEPMRRVGVLVNLAADDPIGQARVAAFVQGLQAAGWVEGRNVRIDIRWAATSTDAAEVRRHAAELVTLAPDVILASGGTTLGPLRQVSRTVPTVFTGVGDPVGAGFVDSLARPGGSATEHRDELAPLHSITSSAVESSVRGTARPSILAVQALMTNSNLVDCTTGKSAGFAPLRMRPA